MSTRKRFQEGSIQKAVYGGRKVWVGLYYDETGTRRKVTLGDRAGGDHAQPPLAIRNEMTRILAPVNEARDAQHATRETTLAAFVEHKYIPFGERKWKRSTATTTKQRLRQHIIAGELGTKKLGELDRETLQRFLDHRGISSYSVVNHLRWDLKAIFDLAIADGLLTRHHAEMLFTPRSVALPRQPVMTPDEVQKALRVLPLRERTFCRLAIYAGMRPGEIIALRWPDIQPGHAIVDNRLYKGNDDTPKNRKPRLVALSPAVEADLASWRMFAVSEDAFVFPSETLKSAIKYENLWQREIKPRFQKIGLAWADFHCMRRTNSTLMKVAGADVKVAADNRGHSLKVSLEEYTQSTLEQKREAVIRLERLIQ